MSALVGATAIDIGKFTMYTHGDIIALPATGKRTMRIVILTMGTRGDVQPYVALGVGFRNAGHDVCVAAPQAYASFVTDRGLEFAPLGGDPVDLIGGLVDKAGANPFRAIQVMANYALPIAVEIIAGVQRATRDADIILSSFLMVIAGHEAARQRKIPHVSAQIFPAFTSTGAFPNPAFPAMRWGSVYNRLTHLLFTYTFWHGSRWAYQIIRRRLPDMPARIQWPFAASVHPRTSTLYGFSPMVVPHPRDWDNSIHVSGYWFLDTDGEWQPPAALVKFLDSGPSPVYIGFGSMVTRDTDRLTRVSLDALVQSGQRGVLLGGWSNLGSSHLPSTVYAIEAVPHDWLFPRMAAIIHHGGAGTTGAAARAGVPQIVVPFTADQPFWGSRVRALGVGPSPVPHKKLTSERLVAYIRSVTSDAAMRQRAAALGERIRVEDGVGNAVRIVEQIAASFQR